MKSPHRDRRELIEDIFAPEHPSSAISEGDVLRLVEQARFDQQRRRQSLAATVAVGFLAAALWSVTSRPVPSSHPAPTTAVAPVPPAPIDEPSSPPVTPPSIEHVDDERMLALLDQTPAALVRWPDGRRSLLVLVARPSSK